MCKDCAWAKVLEEIESALASAQLIPAEGYNFAASVTEKLESIQEWVESKHHVTEAQERAVANMANGIQRWLG